MAELARLARDARGVALVADRGHDVGAAALDRERARAHLLAFGARAPALPRPSGSTRRARGRRCAAACRRRRPGRPARAATTSPSTTSSTATCRGLPSRMTVAVGATSAASRSSVRFARTSCAMPMPAFATRTREEERVLPLAERERHDAGDEQDQVEDREDVRDDDALVGAARRRLRDGPRRKLALGLLPVSDRRARRSSPRLKSRSALRPSGGGGRRRSASRTSRRASRCARGCPCAARG